MPHTVTVEINQQQAELIKREAARGAIGSTPEEVMRNGLLEYLRAHPELAEPKR